VLEGTSSGLRALGHLLALAGPRLPPVSAAVDERRREHWLARLGSGPLDQAQAFALLRDYGIATVEVRAATNGPDAVAAADQVGYPAVLKTDEQVAHKSDVGGVVLGLPDGAAVAVAYQEMCDRLGPRVVLCSTADPGVELSVGLTRDPLVGTVVVVGAGGLLVEVLADRAVGLPPLDDRRAGLLVDRLRLRPVLAGVRGRPGADLVALTAAVRATSAIATELGSGLVALDVNPLVATPRGAVAADVLVVAG
jgi:acyl-CoA synthetase (NDP forming)